jgi:hypothetical protein
VDLTYAASIKKPEVLGRGQLKDNEAKALIKNHETVKPKVVKLSHKHTQTKVQTF